MLTWKSGSHAEKGQGGPETAECKDQEEAHLDGGREAAEAQPVAGVLRNKLPRQRVCGGHAYNPSIQEADSGLCHKFEASLSYTQQALVSKKKVILVQCVSMFPTQTQGPEWEFHPHCVAGERGQKQEDH